MIQNHLKAGLFRLLMLAPSYEYAAKVKKAGTEIKEDSFLLHNTYRVREKTGNPAERFIISADINDMYSGLGCCLFILLPCWKYARETGRTLIIDWRGNPYTRANPQTNLFSRLFHKPDPSEIGVPTVTDDAVNDLRFPQPILGPSERIQHESGAVDMLPAGGLEHPIMRKIIKYGVNVNFPTLIPSLKTTYSLAENLGPRGLRKPVRYSFKEAQRLYRSLKLRPEWADKVAEFHRTHMQDQKVIGVHVRHGNGEGNFHDDFRRREIDDPHAFIESIANKINRFASSRFGKSYTVFLCTDSIDVVNAMKPRFASLITRRIWRPGSNEGITFDHAHKHANGGVGVAADAMIDMQLLAKCDVVFMTRWTKFASHVPYIMEKPGALFFDHEETAQI